MLVEWGLIPDVLRGRELLPVFFPAYCPPDVQAAFAHYHFAGEKDTGGENGGLLTPEVYGSLFEELLRIESNQSGSYYTPENIAEGMCREVINQAGLQITHSSNAGASSTHVLEFPSKTFPSDIISATETRHFLSSVTICDPACGTGKFLVASAEYLAVLWDEVIHQQNLESRMVTFAVNGQFYSVLASVRRYILENSLFGVEKDPLCAEICKLRLLAWYLAPVSGDYFTGNFRLPHLDQIKVGNALIGCPMPVSQEKTSKKSIDQDRRRSHQKYLANLHESSIAVGEADLALLLPFHWSAESPHPFTILISNPPYGNLLSPLEKAILRKTDPMVEDIYINFLLRVARGEIRCQHAAFLTPKSYLLRQNYRDFREILFKHTTPYGIWDIGSKKFKGVLNEVQALFFHADPAYTSTIAIGPFGEAATMRFMLPDCELESLEVPFGRMECLLQSDLPWFRWTVPILLIHARPLMPTLRCANATIVSASART